MKQGTNVRPKFDIELFRESDSPESQYQRQLKRLKSADKEIDSIEKAVDETIANLKKPAQSFVIYGEPQSGKTEMMICLTARLLDEGHTFVLHLLNDSVDLLGQNLGRFKSSGLAPAAKNFSEILDAAVQIKGQPHVVFCKKNGRDLRKLLDKISSLEEVIVIDDEADYASPNAKINRGSRTPINALINQILGDTGVYIGVTATPARLDLNNTFDNDSDLWIDFPPHSKYTGQDVFFPLDPAVEYFRTLLPDSGDDPKYARQALFGFLVNVAYLNVYRNASEENYSFLVHTSGKKADHKSDRTTIYAALDALVTRTSAQFDSYVEFIWNLSAKRFPDAEANTITRYVLDNIARNAIVVLNSERDWKDNSSAATKPTSLFTIIIGGNIVSRGVTLDNLLAMFFTRDVKHKIQQDTYIQRARMFGNRGNYLQFFELTMPRSLYMEWHRCFVFHRLALASIKEGRGSLVWLSDDRISAVATSSIDRSTVDLDRGEMSFALFTYTTQIDRLVDRSGSIRDKLDRLAKIVGDAAFPEYLRNYITKTMPSGDASVAIHKSSDISGYKDPSTDKVNVARSKGFFGKSQMETEQYPKAVHHLRVFHNAGGNARLFYKFVGSIQFISNTKK
jgi:hypothetical protein